MTRVVLLLAVLAAGRGSTSAQEMPQQPAATGVPSTAHSAAEISELQKKADSGDPEAQYALGNAYQDGNGVRKSYERAAVWYRKAADQGNAKAQNSLGVLYWVGDGVDKDKKEAVKWYHKAAKQGNSSAMFNLGAAYYNGEGVATVNDALAYAWFLLSSDAGGSSGQEAAKRSASEHGPGTFNEACFAIGQLYEKGEDLPQNPELAAAWYRKAADHHHTQAQIALAALAAKAKNYTEARHWCEAAAKERYEGGYFCLGYLAQHGLGANIDSKDALKWYGEAAKWGNTRAMQNLGQMYANGEGTKVDRPLAFVWFLTAARRGNRDVIEEAKKLRSSMTNKEWKDSAKKLKQQNLGEKEIDEILNGGGSQPSQ